MTLHFKSTKDAVPNFDFPVLIVVNGILQHVTYCLVGIDNPAVEDWFQPYHFGTIEEDEMCIKFSKVDSWAYLPIRI